MQTRGPSCGHPSHVAGCAPCEAGMRRLLHARDAHGLAWTDCPECAGKGCSFCEDGAVWLFPVKIGACPDGRLCPLVAGGEA